MPQQTDAPADNGADNMPKPPAVPIVAIGASAGGLEAVSELLTHLPPATGFAYVYVQHLAPDQESRLPMILGRVTTMPVLEAEHLMRVEANHVYVIPPDRDLEAVDGVLTLVPRPWSNDPNRSVGHLPIDQFFLSVADRQKNAAVGVLLSGTASDGTLGLRAIKAAGGLTFAQDESARFQSMPKSAIIEGVVDRVLPPAGIAAELEQLSRMSDVFRRTEAAEAEEAGAPAPVGEPGDMPNDAGTDEDVQDVIGLLRRAVGVDFTHYKMTTIRRRMLRRMLLFRFETLSHYAQYLRQHPEEMQLLYNDLLINVTTFFRDEDTMDHLKNVLLPRIINGKSPREPVRIWIPACSTGQEAYSIAILLLEVLGEQAASTSIQIFATDLSETAVAKARQGSYTRGEVMDVDAKRLQRFFTKVDDKYRINKTVRDLCVFAPQNILKDPPFSRLDLISCRNLLIYLDNVFQRKALALFHYALNPTGYLLLGKSETVGSSTSLFMQVEKTLKVYARRNDQSVGVVLNRVSFEMQPRIFDRDASEPPGPLPREGRPTTAGFPERTRRPNPTSSLEKTVDDLLLRQYVPPSVVVNADLDIVHFRGSTGLFLEPAPGKASLNLLKMARPSLAFELRNTLLKAQKSGQPVRKAGLDVRISDQTHYVTIEVVPLTGADEERLYLVLFSEVTALVLASTDAADASNRRIKQLEDELATLREDMRSIIEEQEASNEELQSANEEIISSNEELQSINEELETSKEEIESTNEELLTINQELQVRNDQLSEANEFSEAIFGTIREATLVLDEDLRVRSANPTFYRLFGVAETETEGRLIYELGDRQWDIPQLRTLLTDVIAQNTVVEGYEVSHTFAGIGEKVLRLNARRVVRQQESVLLAIEDITDHRQAQRLLTEREAWMHNLVDNAPVLIWVGDVAGRYTFFNRAWLDYTGRPLDDVVRRGWEDDIHPDDRESYQMVYQSAYAKRQPFQIEIRLRNHGGEYRWMLMNAKPTYAFDGTFDGYIGTCAEIYNRQTLLQALDLRAQKQTQEVLEANAAVQRALFSLTQTGSESPENVESAETRKRAQAGLRRTEERLRMLIEHTPDVITRWDRDLRLLYANPSFEKKTGVPNESLLGKTNAEMGQPVGIALPYMNALRRTIDSGLPQSHYNSFPTPNGIAYFYSSMVPELGPDGVVQSVLAIARDITDLKLVEEIQQTAINLQAVLDSSPAAIGLLRAVRDGQFEIETFKLAVCNQKFADLVHQSVDQLTGLSADQLAKALWQDDTFDVLRHVLTTGEPTYREQYDQTSNRWLAISLSRNGDGVVLTGLDITPLKEAEQQRERLVYQITESQENLVALEQIRQQVRERGEFLRQTSHDLRGSFGVIQGAAQLLDLSGTDEERARMLAMIQRNLRQITQMLTQLLDFSRLEAGQEQVEAAPFDAAELLRELAASVEPTAEERGLTVRTVGPDRLPVRGDAVKVRRIAQNLLLNALRYTEQGYVTIGWDGDGDGWALDVADTGPGLPEAILQRLTAQPDAPAADAAPRPASGSWSGGEGIGLAIVNRLIALLGAQLTVESEPGVGTHFRVRFGGPLPH